MAFDLRFACALSSWLEGRGIFTYEDYLSGRRWDDAVCYSCYPIDVHTDHGLRYECCPAWSAARGRALASMHIFEAPKARESGHRHGKAFATASAGLSVSAQEASEKGRGLPISVNLKRRMKTLL